MSYSGVRQSDELIRPDSLISFMQVHHLLNQRLGATYADIAGWVWAGPATFKNPDSVGFAAYQTTGEGDLIESGRIPERFYYHKYAADCSDDSDYISPLLTCWFDKKEARSLAPELSDRYLCFDDLLKRWSSYLSADLLKQFVISCVKRGLLMEIHPLWGHTNVMDNSNGWRPGIETAMFVVSNVNEVETEELVVQTDSEFSEGGRLQNDPSYSASELALDRARKAGKVRHGQPGGNWEKRDTAIFKWQTDLSFANRQECAAALSEELGLQPGTLCKYIYGIPGARELARAESEN